MPPATPGGQGSTDESFSISGTLKRAGYSEGTVGAVQTSFLRGQEEPWTAEGLKQVSAADVVIHLTREVAGAGIYPAVDLRSSRSRLLDAGAVGEADRMVAAQVRAMLGAALWTTCDPPRATGDRLILERARKLQNYFAQPFVSGGMSASTRSPW